MLPEIRASFETLVMVNRGRTVPLTRRGGEFRMSIGAAAGGRGQKPIPGMLGSRGRGRMPACWRAWRSSASHRRPAGGLLARYALCEGAGRHAELARGLPGAGRSL